MEIINDPVPQNLAKPLKAQSLDEPDQDQAVQPVQPVNTFWREMLPIGVDLAVSFTSQRYPNLSRSLSESKETLGSSGGFLLDKYVPMNLGGMDSEEVGHMIALGLCGLGLFKAYKEDINGPKQSERIGGVVSQVSRTISGGKIPNTPTVINYVAKQIQDDPLVEKDLKIFGKWIKENIGLD